MSIREILKSNTITRKLAEIFRYRLFQIQVKKAEKEDVNFPKDIAGIAIPPARLRHRVHGDLSRERFLQVGKTVAADLKKLALLARRDWSSFSNILDFGCGSARVMRAFLAENSSAHFYGTDIDVELIDWCTKSIPTVDWRTNPFMPPTTYADCTFDMVYAISVFTHLDETYQNAWLAELKRITRPGAILILTVHGETVISSSSLTKLQRSELDEKGFLFVTGTTGKLKLDGLPDFYQTAYHKNDYIQQHWGQYFEVVKQVSRGINEHQDAVVLRKH